MTREQTTNEAIRCPVCDATPAPAGPEVAHAEPLTHCEWCGAEYPEPDDAPAPGASSRRKATGER